MLTISSLAKRSNDVQGTTTSAVLAYKNPNTFFFVVDCDKERIDAWNADLPPLFEPGLAELIASVKLNENHGRLRWKAQPANNYTDHDRPYSYGKDFGNLEENTLRTRAGRTGIKRRPNLAFSTDIQNAIMNSEMIIIAVNTPAKVIFCFSLAVSKIMSMLTDMVPPARERGVESRFL